MRVSIINVLIFSFFNLKTHLVSLSRLLDEWTKWYILKFFEWKKIWGKHILNHGSQVCTSVS